MARYVATLRVRGEQQTEVINATSLSAAREMARLKYGDTVYNVSSEQIHNMTFSAHQTEYSQSSSGSQNQAGSDLSYVAIFLGLLARKGAERRSVPVWNFILRIKSPSASIMLNILMTIIVYMVLEIFMSSGLNLILPYILVTVARYLMLSFLWSKAAELEGRVRKAYSEGDREAAHFLNAEIVETFPLSPDYYYKVSDVACEASDYKEALEYLVRAKRLFNEDEKKEKKRCEQRIKKISEKLDL